MDAHRVDVLDRAHDDAAPGRVGHHLELELLPALDRALDEHLGHGARPEADGDLLAQGLLAPGQPAAAASEREGRTDDGRREPRGQLVERVDDDALGDVEPRRHHRLAKLPAILRAEDRRQVGADQLHPEAVEHPCLGQPDGQVERRLAAERGQERVGPLLLDHLGDRLDVERLEVGRVGPSGSVMIVAGFELTRITRYPWARRTRQACAPE